MNSIEMTNPDGQNTLPTLPKDAPIREEFSFTSSNQMKSTNHLRRFRWFGAAIIFLVTIVTFSTIIHTSKLKEASRKRAAALNEDALSQIQGKNSDLVLNGKTKDLTTLWSPEDSESSDDDEEEDSGEAEVNGTIIKKAGKMMTETRMLELNGSLFKDAWRAMRTKTSKFVVLRQNIWNPRLVDAKLGEWSSTFLEFKTELPAAEAAIGFIYLGNTGQERFYEVVYIPSTMDVQPADIVSRYGLPSDPNELAKVSGCPVANTVVIRSFRELNALNIMKNAKAGAVVSLWTLDEEDNETESSDDEEVDEVVASSAVLAADGANYASVWSAMKSKFNRFVVFRKNANNPKQIEAKLGGWNSLVTEFQAQFPANDEAVGFMILGSGSSEQLYEVVYVPASKTTKPSQVLTNFGLPSNPALLRSNGLQVANTLVVRNYKDINTNNMILNAKTAGIVSAWEEEGLVSLWWGSSESSNDGSAYSEVWNTLKEKTKRFVIFRKNADNSGLVDVTYGDWNTTSADFASSFKVNKAQVGYIYLGTKNHEKLYEVVYAPVALKTNPATILVSFGLPPNPNNLAQYGIEVPSTYVATDKKQIDTGNIIMKATPAGIVSLWGEEGLQSLWWGSSEDSNDGSAYSEVWNTLKEKTKRFVIFRKNADNSGLVDVTYGDWNTTSADFASSFKVNKAQVGYIYLGTKNHEKLYEVVYAPVALKTNPATILVSFGLPPNPNNLAQYGIEVPSTYVATDKKQIDTGNIIMKANAAGIISAWGVDDVIESAQVLAADGANYASVWNAIKAKTNRFVVFRRSAANPKQIEAKLGGWNSIVSEFQAQFPVDQEAVGFMVLGSGAYEQLFEVVYVPSGKSLTAAQVVTNFGLPTNPALLRSNGLQVADTIVVKNYKDITSTNIMLNSKKAGIISAWEEEDNETESSDDEEVDEVVASSAVLAADGANYAAIWNELKGKTKRFVVFRKNANNPKQIEAKIGAWSALVADFQAQFPADQEAVGFMILGSDNNPQLYEVVYIPSTRNISPAQVVANFGLPANPASLKSNGLQVANTLVVRNYNDITTMNMVLNSKQGGVISLWDESSRVLAADGANYAPVWNNIKSKTSRFVVFRKNAANPKQIEAKIGAWNAIVSDFQAQFPVDQEAVGFIVLGSGAYEQLFEVVFVPSGKSLTAAQVLASFNLPTNPALIKSGLQTPDTIVIRNYKDITSTNIMLNSKKAGIISTWWGEEDNDTESTDAGDSEIETETEGGVEVQSLWWGSSEGSNDGSAYSEVWNTLKEKTKRFVIFRKNADNSGLVDVTYGDWNTTSADFASSFKVNKAQVGYIYLGTKNHEKLYEVVYAPVALKTNPATILVSFGLPPNPNNLAQYGIEVPSTYVATDKKQIDTGNIIMKATPAGIVS